MWRMAHTFSALWREAFAGLGIDFVNGFNALSRQAMLDAVQRRCPELTPLFDMFYARNSLCFLTVDNIVCVILGQECEDGMCHEQLWL